MAMSKNTLRDLIAGISDSTDEPTAIQNWADAYATFAEDAQAASAILPTGVALGKAAFIAAAPGLSVTGAQSLATAIVAFWVAVAGGLAASFASATTITPPSAGLTKEAIQAVFDANLAAEEDKVTASNNIAILLHAQAIIGGTVTVGAATTPIT